MRVHINASGREVTIECDDTNITPAEIVALAQATWDRTAGPEPTAPAYGFTTDKRWVDDKTPTGAGMRWRMGEVDA